MSLLDGRERAVFRARFEDSLVPQVMIDNTGLIALANDAFCQLLGRTRAEVIGRRPRQLRAESDRGGADATLASVLAGESAGMQTERIYEHSSGAEVPVLINVTVIRDDDGTVAGATMYVQDLRVLRDSERKLEQQAQFFHALGARARDAALLCDPAGCLIYVSPAVKTLFGYAPEDVVAMSGWDFIHPDDDTASREAFAQVADSGGTRTIEFRVVTRGGEWRWVESTMTSLLHTPIGGVVCNLVDVTDHRAAQAQLRAAELRNRTIVETSRDGIWVVTPEGATEFANTKMAEILGRPLSEVYELPVAALLSRPGDAARLVDTHRERRPREAQVYEIDYDHTDGSARRLQVSAAPLAFGDGSFTGALATVSDVTEQRRMEAELRHAILHDPLTGLPNGALLDDRLNQALVRHAGTSEAAVTVLVLDLDQFKMVNDSRGHEAGDQVLVAVAERLHGLVRPQDTVARLGGDAFVIVRVDSDPADGEELAAALLEEIARPVLIDGGKITLSASIGVASCPPYDGADLLRFADTAMFAAKAGGRSQARTFDRRLAEAAERDYALASSLRVALDDELLDMHYQPVVELATGAVVGYEALARWTHRERGEVSPELFVPVAERVGLSRQLDRWAVRRGVRDLQQLRGSDAVAVDAYVAINLSARHLGDEHLESAIVSATENAGLSPGDVCLEITEGAVMHDIQATAQVLTNLRERGYRIAIDDFGTGHSSLAYLRDLPITALKVDRSFVQDMSTDDDVYAIVASIVQMAHAIGVDTVAEGVETLDQARQLRDLGCTAAQGWLWDKAMPAADLAVAPRRYDVPTDGANRPDRRRTRRPQIELTEQHGLSRLIALQGEGASLTTIAAALNSEAYRTPTGQRWHRISVARALRDLLP